MLNYSRDSVHLCWQILDEIVALIPSSEACVDGESQTKVTDHHPDQILDAASFPSSLLFQGEAKIEEHLSEFSGRLGKLISRMYASASTISETTSSIHSQLTRALAGQKTAQIERDRSRAETVQLEERLEAAIERYMMAEKKLDRAKSATVAKLERQALLGPQKAAGEVESVKREESETNGNIDSNDGVVKAEMEESNNRLAALSEKQTEQIAALEAENVKLSSQITELQIKVNGFPRRDVLTVC